MLNMYSDLKTKYKMSLVEQNISLDGLQEAIHFYTKASEKFHQRLAKIDKTQ
jgi:hypothetical protein